MHGKSSLCLPQWNLAFEFLRKRVAFSMTGLPLFVGFLSSTLFVDFETRSSLAFLLGSGLMQAQLAYLPRHIDILQTPSPLFGLYGPKTRDVVSFSSLDVFVSSEQSCLKDRNEILSKVILFYYSLIHCKVENTSINWSEGSCLCMAVPDECV